MTDTNPFGDLALRCPPIDVDEAATIARDLFGREGKVRELGSNQDRNYRVDAPEGRFVLKIANPGWERVALEAQNAAMAHLAACGLAFAVPVPAVSPNGNLDRAADPRRRDLRRPARHLRRGRPARCDAVPVGEALRAVGRIAAQTTDALIDFSHPGTDRTIQWDLRLARPVVEALDHWVREDARRAQARRLLETAEATLDPLRDVLPQQVVHADITDYNVMATRDRAGRMMPTGLIDFGDLMSTWRISDIATAVQSLVLGQPTRALEVAIEVTRGFHDVLALSDDEIAAVWPLILARASVCAVCEEQQAILEPDNAYAQEFLGGGWIVADAVETVTPAVAHEALRAALGLGPSRRVRAAAARLAEIGATARAARPGRARRRARPVGARRRAAVRRLGRPGREPHGGGRRTGRHRALGGGPARPRPARAAGSAGVGAPRRRRVRRRRDGGVGAGRGVGGPRRTARRGARLRRRRDPARRHRPVRPRRRDRRTGCHGRRRRRAAARRSAAGARPRPGARRRRARRAGTGRAVARRRLARPLPRPVAAARPRRRRAASRPGRAGRAPGRRGRARAGALLRGAAGDRARLAPPPVRHRRARVRRHGQQRRGARALPPARGGARGATAAPAEHQLAVQLRPDRARVGTHRRARAEGLDVVSGWLRGRRRTTSRCASSAAPRAGGT